MAATEPMTETGSIREGVSGPFIRHPVATTLLMVAILLVGVVAYPLLPVAPLPQIDFPTIVVSASLPGASPDTMASSVAQPLERQIAQIPGVTQMTSTSSLGATAITVQFDLDRNIDAAAGDIQGAINAASGQLPKILPSSPTYRKVNPADAPILILSLTSDTAPITEVDDVAENILAQQISQISGVSLVRIGGQQQPAIRVQIDPAKLVEKGLQLEDVRAQLAIATTDNPKGLINGAQQSFTIFDNDQLTEPAAWNDVIIAYRNGAPVRVRDIGQAVRGPADVYQAAWGNGKRDVFLVVFKVPGVNVIKTVEKVKSTMTRLQAAIPASMHISVLSDRTTTIRASVEDVQFTLMLTIALVVMVIFVFLRNLWATVIPSFTVPLALLGACAMMWAVSYSLDNLSLMALTIAVGFVVDDAIVVLENITRHVEHGMKPMQAALKGAGEIGFTVVSISMSLIAVLIPLLLMSGIIGRLFREFSVTLAMTIVVSAVVSLTLTPMLASRFLRDHTHDRHNKIYMLFERGFAALTKAYEHGLDRVLRHRFITLMVFLATLVATVALFIAIPKGFFPQQDTGTLFGTSDASQDVSFAEMAKLQEQLLAVVQSDPDVVNVAGGIGAGVGASAQNSGRMFITLKPREERTADAFQIIARLRPKLAQVKGARLFLQVAQDVTVGARFARTQFQYTVQDANLEELNAWAPKILAKLGELPRAARRRHRPADRRHDADARHRPRHGVALRHPTAADRRHALRRLRAAAGHPVFHPDQHLLRHRGDSAVAAGRPEEPGQALRPLADHRPDGADERVREMDDQSHRAAVDQPPRTVSRHHHQLQPRAGRGARPGDRGGPGGRARSASAPRAVHHLPGQRASVPGVAGHRAALDPGGAGRRLHHPRRALRELHPPADDSVDPALGRLRRARRC